MLADLVAQTAEEPFGLMIELVSVQQFVQYLGEQASTVTVKVAMRLVQQ